MTPSHDPFDDRATRAASAVREAARDSDLEGLLQRIEDARARPWWLVPTLVAGAAAATITAILVVPGLLGGEPAPVIAPVGSGSPSEQTPTTDPTTDPITDPTTGPTATEQPTTGGPAACQPTTVDVPDRATEGLSAAARETYDRIVAAAARCDLAELTAIADEGEPVLVSFGGIYLDEEWLRSDRQWLRPHEDPGGNPNIVEILRRTLTMSTLVQTTGDGLTLHSWPAAFVEMTTERRQELLDSGLYTEADLDRYEEFGGFAGWRLLITEDGDWTVFIAGD